MPSTTLTGTVYIYKLAREVKAQAAAAVLEGHGVLLFFQDEAPGSPYVNVHILEEHLPRARAICMTMEHVILHEQD